AALSQAEAAEKNTVPAAWKTACIVPVPKRPVISSLNDLRPVALTSAVMKVCERVVLCKLDSLVKDYTDPLQFAYRRNRSTDDAVLYVLENIYSHLEKAGSSVRLMFFDFSSAFNTIQPHLLVQKLLNMKLPSSVISWIFDYLTNRLQYVRLNGVLSSVICTNTGAPQGTVLAPFLFSLYTADCRSTDESCPLVKFADDTELVGKISNDEDALCH
ncbi:RNA-directed DNA polymerase, partial [Thiolapillus sp.]|uniref:RNA-directed DNA polymerase n=1 Tax=Thiolapillus sp. TaxID=2017437 RepID=UPI003AF9A6A7